MHSRINHTTLLRIAVLAIVMGVPCIGQAQQHMALDAFRFVRNEGQWDRRAGFMVDRGMHRVWFAAGYVMYDLQNAAGLRHAVRLRFAGGDDDLPQGIGTQDTRLGFAMGGRAVQDVHAFDEVRYRGLYPGIDLRYYQRGGALKYDLIVDPHADPTRIRLLHEGADDVAIEKDGSLRIGTSVGVLREEAPYCYQDIDGRRRVVQCRFVRDTCGITFALGAYDHAHPLVIDPVLIYSSYLGGSGSDEGRGVALDNAKNIYVTGISRSVDFPANPGPHHYDNTANIFIAKLDPTGSVVRFITYLGGAGYDAPSAIRVRSDGTAVIVAGTTMSSDFPTTPGVFDRLVNDAGAGDGFVLGVNPATGALLFSTYVGGDSADEITDLTLSRADTAIYLTGWTRSTNFPAADGPRGGGEDAFVAKLSRDGARLQKSRLLAGSSDERATGIEMQDGGAMWVSGWTTSRDLRATDPYQEFGTPGQGRDCFAARVWFDGTGGDYTAIIGGGGDDEARAISVVTDPPGSLNDIVYLTGGTTSPNFPVVGFDPVTPGASPTWFVTRLAWDKIPTSEADIVYSGYLVGAGSGVGTSIHATRGGDVFLAGLGRGPFVTRGIAADPPLGGDDIGLVQLDGTGIIVESSLVGGALNDTPWPETVLSVIDREDDEPYVDLYVTGTTISHNFPLRRGALDNVLNDDRVPDSTDAFLIRFGFGKHPAIFAPSVFEFDMLRCDTVAFDTLIVSNLGDSVLTITRHLPTEGAPFMIVEPARLPVTVPAHGTVRYVIRYRPTGTPLDTAGTLQIFSNDAMYGANPFKVTLRASHDVPTLRSSHESLQFDTVLFCNVPVRREISFRNSGTGPVTVVDAGFAKGGDNAFGVAMKFPFELRPGDPITATVQFQPIGSGFYYDTLLVRLKECNTVMRVPVQGFAAVQDVDFVPAELVFPTLGGCSRSVVDSVLLVNHGPGTIHPSRLEVWSRKEQREFSLEQPLPESLPSGGSVYLHIRFSPALGAGIVQDTLIVTLAECGQELRLPVRGERSPDAVLEALPTQLDFGSLVLCPGTAVDSVLAVMLGNPGTDPVTLDFQNPGADFVLVDAPGTSFTLGGGESLIVHVRYLPGSTGTHASELQVGYQAGLCVDTLHIPLRGALDERRLTPAVTDLFLDTIRACRRTLDTVLMVYNRSPLPVTVQGMVPGTLVEHVGPVPPREILPGDSVELRLRVTPLQEGNFTERIIYQLAPCGDSIVVLVHGRKEGATFDLARDTVQFAPRVACDPVPGTDSVVVRNLGSSVPVTIQEVGLSGDASFRLVSTGVEGRALLPGESVAIHVAFDSTAPGDYAGEILVVLGPCGDTLRARLAGSVQPVDAEFMDVDFGSVPVSREKRMTLTVHNTSSLPVRVESIGNVVAPFSVVTSPLPATIPPGDSVQVELAFVPDAPVLYTPTVLVQLSAPCALTLSVQLSGAGTAADAFCLDMRSSGRTGEVVEIPLRAVTTSHPMPPTALVYHVRYAPERLQFLGTDRTDIQVVNDSVRGLLVLTEPAAVQIRPEQFRLRFRLLLGRTPVAAVHLDSVQIGTAAAALDVCGDSAVVMVVDHCVFTNVTFSKTSNMLGDIQPNPARGWAELTYQQMEDVRAVLRVYDAMGREVLRPLDAEMPGGRYTLGFSLESLPAGTYFYTIEAGEYRASKQLVITR